MLYTNLAMACCGLLMLAGQDAVSAENHATNPYPLPRDKSAIVPCQQAALNLHPGSIQDFLAKSTPVGFQYRFTIRGQNGWLWVMVCDGATQSIVKNQTLEW